MRHADQVVVKRWVPILVEYERTKAKVTPRPFRYVKDLCQAQHLSGKELRRYYRKWVAGGKDPEGLLPARRGPKPGSRRTPKPIERAILTAYRRFGSNRYELVALFQPYYLDQTPSPATMDRIKARYPLNRKDRRVIKRYEKRYPGELAHIDLTAVPRDLSRSLHCRELYSGAVCDDCTRLTYAEVLRDKKNFTLTYFFARALSWFQQIYHFEFAAVLSDNGGEFKGTLAREHPFETFCQQTGIRHHYTRAYRPQTNGKIEAFCKIVKHEFLEPNDFASLQELVLNLGGFLFQFNHLRLHGGLNHITPFDKLRKTTELLS